MNVRLSLRSDMPNKDKIWCWCVCEVADPGRFDRARGPSAAAGICDLSATSAGKEVRP